MNTQALNQIAAPAANLGLTNMRIEITVYDANPNMTGDCAWRDTFSGMLNRDYKISAAAKRRIAAAARKCGEYCKGDRLWLIARDEDGGIDDETTICI
jgi:hypothetical protein